MLRDLNFPLRCVRLYWQSLLWLKLTGPMMTLLHARLARPLEKTTSMWAVFPTSSFQLQVSPFANRMEKCSVRLPFRQHTEHVCPFLISACRPVQNVPQRTYRVTVGTRATGAASHTVGATVHAYLVTQWQWSCLSCAAGDSACPLVCAVAVHDICMLADVAEGRWWYRVGAWSNTR